jgi:hypothetical protein
LAGLRLLWRSDAQPQAPGYRRNSQPFCPLLKDYGSRINCEQSTTHQQTIRAKLTDIYAMERNYLSGPIK